MRSRNPTTIHPLAGDPFSLAVVRGVVDYTVVQLFRETHSFLYRFSISPELSLTRCTTLVN